jgi:hypothetical protein
MNSLKLLMDTLGVTLEELRSGSRQRRLVDARSLAAALLMRQPPTRQRDVAQLLGISQPAVSQLLARHKGLLKGYPPYRRRWNQLAGMEDGRCGRQGVVISDF